MVWDDCDVGRAGVGWDAGVKCRWAGQGRDEMDTEISGAGCMTRPARSQHFASRCIPPRGHQMEPDQEEWVEHKARNVGATASASPSTGDNVRNTKNATGVSNLGRALYR